CSNAQPKKGRKQRAPWTALQGEDKGWNCCVFPTGWQWLAAIIVLQLTHGVRRYNLEIYSNWPVIFPFVGQNEAQSIRLP
ncbi:mCG144959, partial [Mus musculus]